MFRVGTNRGEPFPFCGDLRTTVVDINHPLGIRE